MWNKTRLVALVWVFVLFLIQNGLHTLFADQAPWVLLAGVLFYSMLEGPLFGLLIGCYAGFFLDLFGTGSFGISMAIFGFMGLLSGVSGAKLFSESPVTQVLIPTAACYLVLWLNLLIYRMAIQGDAFSFKFFMDAFLPWQLTLMAVSSPVVFVCLKKLSLNKRRRRDSWA